MRFFGRHLIATLLLLFAPAPVASAEEAPPPEPDGYRLDHYHAPTPATLKGATVIGSAQAFDLWTGKLAAFVDMVGRPKRPSDLLDGEPWTPPPRRDIPGSLWLPGAGAGELTPELMRYFTRGLQRATDGDRSKPIVFYCRTHCWASWNGAKRAIELGYRNVLWYPDGADGWEKAGHPLEDREPAPME